MPSYKRNLLNHFKEVEAALTRLGASAHVSVLDFRLEVRMRTRTLRFWPQFIEYRHGKKRFSPVFGADSASFIGWLPYFNKRWDLSSEKVKFKDYVSNLGFATPEYSMDSDCRLRDVLVKRNRGSWGETIRGPFKCATECPLSDVDGEYYERYMHGRIAKIWFWNGRPVCLEYQDAPRIQGDGSSTVEELALHRLAQLGWEGESAFDQVQDLLAYQDLTRGSVPGAGCEFLIDFRYASAFTDGEATQNIRLPGSSENVIDDQLKDIGCALYMAIPEAIRRNTVFTVDAVLDDRSRLWFLEMNSNPSLHPYVYEPMFQSAHQDTTEPASSQSRLGEEA